ncbi:peptidylprolyl isomerase [Bdellovibrio svalbardensis]|uniref:Peptidylprolyl isomerase n=1 Tax=Bdellovibrio svalbardensis TaxID=2972972 RepID=A0ABT6DJL0_9BACT|nr:peptidylprolyl isomerase [Bdellovibrio svalbardensis]MDG0817032.1 peptidylprolyl isomerase [Bdellovibrio svalbardensis]
MKKSDRDVIRISSDQVESIRLDYAKQAGQQPSEIQLKALVQDKVDEEILVREARRLLLDKGDESVRLRLISKMRALGEGAKYASEEELLQKAYDLRLDEDTIIRRHLVHKMQILLAQSDGDPAPSDDDIKKFIEQNPQPYEAASRVTFSQVFIASQSNKKALSLLRKLQTSPDSLALIETLSDPFPLGLRLTEVSESLLQRRFGQQFSKLVFAGNPGQWIGPLESPFGLHLVRVEEVSSKRSPSFEDIKPAALRSLIKVRAVMRTEENMDRLRKLYLTEVGWNFKRTDNASL